MKKRLEELKALWEAGYVFYLYNAYGYDAEAAEDWEEVVEELPNCEKAEVYDEDKEVWFRY